MPAALLAAVLLVPAHPQLLSSRPTELPNAGSLTQVCGNAGTPGPVEHVIWIFMENESYGDVIGSPNAPFQNSLAGQCGSATNFHNESHGSLSNYMAATDGQGILNSDFVTDCVPNVKSNLCVSAKQNIFSQVQAAGMSWRNYAEDMPSNCYQAASGDYVAHHVPALYYTDLTSCSLYAIPMGNATTETGQFYTDVSDGTLPNFSFISPNLIDDAHSSSTATGDAWLSRIVPYITSGPNYQSGNTVIFITNDEGNGADQTRNEDCSAPALSASQPSCHVPTIVVAPYVPAGLQDGTFYTHYSMLRTTEELLGLPLLGLAASANSMTANFNLGSVSDDFAPPTAPSDLTAQTVDSSQVDLSWSASSPGTAAISGYRILRNGAVIATATATRTSFADRSAIAGTSYSYSVEAVDNVGNVSQPSNTANAETPSTTNLLANPDFSDWSGGEPTGWSSYGSATTVTESPSGENGDPAATIATTSSSYTAAGIQDGSTPTIHGTTVAGEIYSASCWVEASTTINVSIGLHETGRQAVLTTRTLPEFGTWYQIQVSDLAAKSGDSMPMTVSSTNMVSGGAALSVSNCSLAVDSTNLLRNPTFSQWSSGLPLDWYPYGPATALARSTSAFGGNTAAAQVATTATSYTASGINAGTSNASPAVSSTVAGASYAGSCWVRASEIITIDVALHEVSPNGSSVNAAAVTALKVPTATSWYDVGVSDTAVATGNMLWFSVSSTNTVAGGATFEVGSCSLWSAPPGGTP